MKRTQLFALTIGVIGLVGSSAPAMAAGCGYGPVLVPYCGPAMAPSMAMPMMQPRPMMQARPMMRPMHVMKQPAPMVQTGSVMRPVGVIMKSVPVMQPAPRPMQRPKVQVPAQNVTVNFKQPMSHLRSVRYSQSPAINLVKVHSSDLSASALASKLPESSQGASGAGCGAVSSNCTGGQFASNRAGRAMSGGQSASGGDYWETVSGPTTLGSTAVSQIVCRRAGARSASMQSACPPVGGQGGMMQGGQGQVGNMSQSGQNIVVSDWTY